MAQAHPPLNGSLIKEQRKDVMAATWRKQFTCEGHTAEDRSKGSLRRIRSLGAVGEGSDSNLRIRPAAASVDSSKDCFFAHEAK